MFIKAWPVKSLYKVGSPQSVRLHQDIQATATVAEKSLTLKIRTCSNSKGQGLQVYTEKPIYKIDVS